ncbi:DUF4013 domain-containing protein [Methanobacterium paludis]|uniref:DUF4013 domain-containing protein n=1 Tax=Methanobacterium paludis (strain DSM 25820 / JCM 18151 / SWAN1) TaxID=868131 RepID=F6D2V9_METPW|nr:DUF4013 domain-containing protein [Methanobacterium paludis]AEG19088.1 hypothetical protein MSWAN_2080 [Methanobacterium paludis]
MDVGGIVSDAIKYPISDWKKILMLGIIIVISSISGLAASIGTTNSGVLTVLGIIGFLVGLLISGYILRIIKASLAGVSEIPDFDSWPDMFIDGIKVAVVGIVYAIPAILVIIISVAAAAISLGISELSNPSAAAGLLMGAGIGGTIAFLYLLIIIPIIAMAIANMAYNDTFGSAFKFNEILNKIGSIGWGNLIIWYIVMIVLYFVMALIGAIISSIFSIISPVVGSVVLFLFIMPYIYMFIARSVGLEYISDNS